MEIADERERLHTWLTSSDEPYLPALRDWLASQQRRIEDVQTVAIERNMFCVPLTIRFTDGRLQNVTLRKEGDTYGWETKNHDSQRPQTEGK